ncbi:hypothetical protein [Gracilibacillus salinarum]|uniref:DUF3953 domain-containing protein n=1 Tax=Gracilibacillus salinarum TaxID=2932255 RepID=A0ABY4GQ49_9BACI|nr:hypothetical protein [Gracilibacillus salinarum]UOQ86369.1 hypothetical protein MUN87_05650 [Gracilibacillus salinarum]
MLKLVRQIIAVIVLFICIYGFFSSIQPVMPYILFGLAIILLLMGAEEWREGKAKACLYFATSILTMIVLIQVIY